MALFDFIDAFRSKKKKKRAGKDLAPHNPMESDDSHGPDLDSFDSDEERDTDDLTLTLESDLEDFEKEKRRKAQETPPPSSHSVPLVNWVVLYENGEDKHGELYDWGRSSRGSLEQEKNALRESLALRAVRSPEKATSYTVYKAEYTDEQGQKKSELLFHTGFAPAKAPGQAPEPIVRNVIIYDRKGQEVLRFKAKGSEVVATELLIWSKAAMEVFAGVVEDSQEVRKDVLKRVLGSYVDTFEKAGLSFDQLAVGLEEGVKKVSAASSEIPAEIPEKGIAVKIPKLTQKKAQEKEEEQEQEPQKEKSVRFAEDEESDLKDATVQVVFVPKVTKAKKAAGALDKQQLTYLNSTLHAEETQKPGKQEKARKAAYVKAYSESNDRPFVMAGKDGTQVMFVPVEKEYLKTDRHGHVKPKNERAAQEALTQALNEAVEPMNAGPKARGEGADISSKISVSEVTILSPFADDSFVKPVVVGAIKDVVDNDLSSLGKAMVRTNVTCAPGYGQANKTPILTPAEAFYERKIAGKEKSASDKDYKTLADLLFQEMENGPSEKARENPHYQEVLGHYVPLLKKDTICTLESKTTALSAPFDLALSVFLPLKEDRTKKDKEDSETKAGQLREAFAKQCNQDYTNPETALFVDYVFDTYPLVIIDPTITKQAVEALNKDNISTLADLLRDTGKSARDQLRKCHNERADFYRYYLENIPAGKERDKKDNVRSKLRNIPQRPHAEAKIVTGYNFETQDELKKHFAHEVEVTSTAIIGESIRSVKTDLDKRNREKGGYTPAMLILRTEESIDQRLSFLNEHQRKDLKRAFEEDVKHYLENGTVRHTWKKTKAALKVIEETNPEYAQKAEEQLLKGYQPTQERFDAAVDNVTTLDKGYKKALKEAFAKDLQGAEAYRKKMVAQDSKLSVRELNARDSEQEWNADSPFEQTSEVLIQIQQSKKPLSNEDHLSLTTLKNGLNRGHTILLSFEGALEAFESNNPQWNQLTAIIDPTYTLPKAGAEILEGLHEGDERFNMIAKWQSRPGFFNSSEEVVRALGAKGRIIFESTDDAIQNRAEAIVYGADSIDARQFAQLNEELERNPNNEGLKAKREGLKQKFNQQVEELVKEAKDNREHNKAVVARYIKLVKYHSLPEANKLPNHSVKEIRRNVNRTLAAQDSLFPEITAHAQNPIFRTPLEALQRLVVLAGEEKGAYNISPLAGDINNKDDIDFDRLFEIAGGSLNNLFPKDQLTLPTDEGKTLQTSVATFMTAAAHVLHKYGNAEPPKPVKMDDIVRNVQRIEAACKKGYARVQRDLKIGAGRKETLKVDDVEAFIHVLTQTDANMLEAGVFEDTAKTVRGGQDYKQRRTDNSQKRKDKVLKRFNELDETHRQALQTSEQKEIANILTGVLNQFYAPTLLDMKRAAVTPGYQDHHAQFLESNLQNVIDASLGQQTAEGLLTLAREKAAQADAKWKAETQKKEQEVSTEDQEKLAEAEKPVRDASSELRMWNIVAQQTEAYQALGADNYATLQAFALGQAQRNVVYLEQMDPALKSVADNKDHDAFVKSKQAEDDYKIEFCAAIIRDPKFGLKGMDPSALKEKLTNSGVYNNGTNIDFAACATTLKDIAKEHLKQRTKDVKIEDNKAITELAEALANDYSDDQKEAFSGRVKAEISADEGEMGLSDLDDKGRTGLAKKLWRLKPRSADAIATALKKQAAELLEKKAKALPKDRDLEASWAPSLKEAFNGPAEALWHEHCERAFKETSDAACKETLAKVNLQDQVQKNNLWMALDSTMLHKGTFDEAHIRADIEALQGRFFNQNKAADKSGNTYALEESLNTLTQEQFADYFYLYLHAKAFPKLFFGKSRPPEKQVAGKVMIAEGFGFWGNISDMVGYDSHMNLTFQKASEKLEIINKILPLLNESDVSKQIERLFVRQYSTHFWNEIKKEIFEKDPTSGKAVFDTMLEQVHSRIYMPLLAQHAYLSVEQADYELALSYFNNSPNAEHFIPEMYAEKLLAREQKAHQKLREEGNQPTTSLLHEAVKAGNVEAVAALLAAGADVALLDKDGKTPLDLVAEKINECDLESQNAIDQLGAEARIAVHLINHEAPVSKVSEVDLQRFALVLETVLEGAKVLKDEPLELTDAGNQVIKVRPAQGPVPRLVRVDQQEIKGYADIQAAAQRQKDQERDALHKLDELLTQLRAGENVTFFQLGEAVTHYDKILAQATTQQRYTMAALPRSSSEKGARGNDLMASYLQASLLVDKRQNLAKGTSGDSDDVARTLEVLLLLDKNEEVQIPDPENPDEIIAVNAKDAIAQVLQTVPNINQKGPAVLQEFLANMGHTPIACARKRGFGDEAIKALVINGLASKEEKKEPAIAAILLRQLFDEEFVSEEEYRARKAQIDSRSVSSSDDNSDSDEVEAPEPVRPNVKVETPNEFKVPNGYHKLHIGENAVGGYTIDALKLIVSQGIMDHADPDIFISGGSSSSTEQLKPLVVQVSLPEEFFGSNAPAKPAQQPSRFKRLLSRSERKSKASDKTQTFNPAKTPEALAEALHELAVEQYDMPVTIQVKFAQEQTTEREQFNKKMEELAKVALSRPNKRTTPATKQNPDPKSVRGKDDGVFPYVGDDVTVWFVKARESAKGKSGNNARGGNVQYDLKKDSNTGAHTISVIIPASDAGEDIAHYIGGALSFLGDNPNAGSQSGLGFSALPKAEGSVHFEDQVNPYVSTLRFQVGQGLNWTSDAVETAWQAVQSDGDMVDAMGLLSSADIYVGEKQLLPQGNPHAQGKPKGLPFGGGQRANPSRVEPLEHSPPTSPAPSPRSSSRLSNDDSTGSLGSSASVRTSSSGSTPSQSPSPSRRASGEYGNGGQAGASLDDDLKKAMGNNLTVSQVLADAGVQTGDGNSPPNAEQKGEETHPEPWNQYDGARRSPSKRSWIKQHLPGGKNKGKDSPPFLGQ